MNPKKSFDMYHIWLAPRHILNVPTLIVTCATVSMQYLNHQMYYRSHSTPFPNYKNKSLDFYLTNKNYIDGVSGDKIWFDILKSSTKINWNRSQNKFHIIPTIEKIIFIFSHSNFDSCFFTWKIAAFTNFEFKYIFSKWWEVSTCLTWYIHGSNLLKFSVSNWKYF